MISELQELNAQQRSNRMSSYTRQAVQSGMMTSEDAQIFARELGRAVGDEAAGSAAAQAAAKATEGSAEMLRDAAQETSKILANGSVAAAAEGGEVGYVDASRAIGAATAGLTSYNEVIAKAEMEYLDGIISYEQYIDTLNKAESAQSKYNDVILNAIRGSNDKGATAQAIKSQAEGIVGEEGVKAIEKAIDVQLQSLSPFGKEFAGEFQANYFERAIANNPALEGVSSQDLRDAKNTVNQNRTPQQQELAKEYDRLAAEANAAADATRALHGTLEGAAYSWAASGESIDEVTTVAQYIKNNPLSDVAKMLEGGEIDFDKIQNQILMEGMPGVAGQLGVGRPGLESNDFTDEELQQTLVYLKGIADEEERYAEASRLGSMNAKQRAADVVAINAGISEELREGDFIKENGIEAVNAVKDLMDSDLSDVEQQFLIDTYINGNKVSPEQFIELMNEYEIKAAGLKNVPSDILLSLGIDTEDPNDVDRYGTKENIANMQLADTMMNESLPEEVDRTYAAKFIIMDGEGNILPPEKMSKNLVNVKKAWNKFSKKDNSTEEDIIEYAIQVMPKITMSGSGEEVGDRLGAQGVYNMINDTIGLDSFNDLDLGTKMAILNIAISTDIEGAEDAARALELQQLLTKNVGLTTAIAAAQELQEIDARQKQRESEAKARINSLGSGNGSSGSNSGGSGGGNDDKDWFEQLEEDSNWAKNMYGRLTKAGEKESEAKGGWIQWMRDNTNLTEEAIQAIAEDDKAMAKLEKMGKGKAKGFLKKQEKKYLNMQYREERDQFRADQERNEINDSIDADNTLNDRTKEMIKSNDTLSAMYAKGGKFQERAVKLANEKVIAETTQVDLLQDQIDRQNILYEAQAASLNLSIAKEEYKYNMLNIPLQEQNATLNARIAAERAKGVEPIQDQIKEEQYLIKELQRQYVVNEKNIKSHEKEKDVLQRKVEDMRRALDLRQREGQMLDHDLKLMGYMEENINKAYDKRIESLDKVLQINEAIAKSQQDQLGLADALSRGDLGAAAAAAQQMQQNQMQFASEQYRNQLEVNKENAINNLTGAESGMTKEQITERQRELEEDSYQTNLKIRAVEDQIYDLNMKIRNEQDVINGYKEKIEKHNEKIRDHEWNILQFERQKIEPLEKIVKENERLIKINDANKLVQTENARIQLAYLDEGKKMQDAHNDAKLAGLKLEEAMGKSIKATAGALRTATDQANQFWKGVESGNGALLDMSDIKIPSLSAKMEEEIKKVKNAKIEIATPFEEIVAANSTYSVPASAVGSAAVNGIMGAVTNNYNTNNVNVSSVTSSSADDIANLVMQKINFAQMGNVR